MSTLKATPGPYRADGPDMFGDYNLLHEGDELAVAAVVSNMRPPEEVKANADLQAASYDLYEALENITGAFNTPIMRRRLEGNKFALEAIQSGVKALSRARGEKQD